MHVMGLDTVLAYRLTAIIVGYGQFVAGLEMVFLYGSGRADTYLPWRVVRLRSVGAGPRLLLLPVESLFRPSAFLAIEAARVCAAAGLVVTHPFSQIFTGCATVLLLSLLCDSYRNFMGGEGSDQMFFVIVATLFLCANSLADDFVRLCGLGFIAGQSVLSYTASGVAKLISPTWRSGAATAGVLSTVGHGVPALGDLLYRYRWLAISTSWFVILFEVSFVLALFGPRVAIVYCVVGVSFHLAIAYVMGLNLFLIAFPAAYPAVISVATHLAALRPRF
jgi:hypothetical protein